MNWLDKNYFKVYSDNRNIYSHKKKTIYYIWISTLKWLFIGTIDGLIYTFIIWYIFLVDKMKLVR